jgi:hypothetical protein
VSNKKTEHPTDPIDYSRTFREHVQGRLYARFHTDPKGEPEYEEDEEGLRHYTIDVHLESPRADEIDSVSYFMDDETYVDPNGYSEDADNDFREVIESYGQVLIEVTVNLGGRDYKQRVWLSQMLQNGYGGETNAAILDAIERIRKN